MVFYILDSEGIGKLGTPKINLLDDLEFTSPGIERSITQTISDITQSPCMVRIHSKQCGHCLNMENDYRALNMDSLNGIMNIMDIEVSSDAYRNHNSEWVSETMDKPVPHIFIMKNGEIIDEYSGDRSTSDMSRFMNRHVSFDKSADKPASSKFTHLPSSISVQVKRTAKKRRRKKNTKKQKSGKKKKRRRSTSKRSSYGRSGL